VTTCPGASLDSLGTLTSALRSARGLRPATPPCARLSAPSIHPGGMRPSQNSQHRNWTACSRLRHQVGDAQESSKWRAPHRAFFLHPTREASRWPRGQPAHLHKPRDPASILPATASDQTCPQGTGSAPIDRPPRCPRPPIHVGVRCEDGPSSTNEAAGGAVGAQVRRSPRRQPTRHPSRWEVAAARGPRLAACPDTYPACYRPTLEPIGMVAHGREPGARCL
jgi:hypothetical protein